MKGCLDALRKIGIKGSHSKGSLYERNRCHWYFIFRIIESNLQLLPLVIFSKSAAAKNFLGLRESIESVTVIDISKILYVHRRLWNKRELTSNHWSKASFIGCSSFMPLRLKNVTKLPQNCNSPFDYFHPQYCWLY